jgi:hypothetical protein
MKASTEISERESSESTLLKLKPTKVIHPISIWVLTHIKHSFLVFITQYFIGFCYFLELLFSFFPLLFPDFVYIKISKPG